MKAQIVGFDNYFIAQLQRLPPVSRYVFEFATFAASGWQITLTAGAAIVLALVYHRPHAAVAFAAALVAIGGINLLKLILRRPRPITAYVKQFNLVSNYSFPSGHSAASLLVHGLLAWMAQAVLVPALAAPISVALWSLVLLVGLSRIYLGAHFPTDVLGGWLFGGLALWLIIAV